MTETRMTDSVADQGLAKVVIARRGPNDQVAGVIFLIDSYCLGVKDVVLFIGAESAWKLRTQAMREGRNPLVDVSPEYLRKFVEGAVAYSRSFGIAPHRDWSHAVPIFGDIDASQCSTEFTYGLNGKPCFIQGPFDGPDRIRQIMSLINHNGPGSMNFVVSSSDFDQDEEGESFDAEDVEETDEFVESRDETSERRIEHQNP